MKNLSVSMRSFEENEIRDALLDMSDYSETVVKQYLKKLPKENRERATHILNTCGRSGNY